MSFFKAKQLGFLAGLTVLALGVAQGCSSGDDSQATPGGGAGGAAGKAGSTGKSGSGNSNGGNDTPGAGGEAGSTPTSNGGDAGTAGTSPVGEEAGAAGAAPVACDGPNGCYSCAPTTDIQFANYCVTGGCPAHFDNSTLSKLAKVGTL
jgi:hypothetical protein